MQTPSVPREAGTTALDRLSAAVAKNNGSTVTITKADACVLGLCVAKLMTSEHWPVANELDEVLNQIETYLADCADIVDGDYGIPAPNKEMSLLCELRYARGINGTPSAVRARIGQRPYQDGVHASRRELKNIATAERFNREVFRNDTEFADWAQSRARYALADEAGE